MLHPGITVDAKPAARHLIQKGEDLSISGFHESPGLLIVRLPVFVAHDLWRFRLEGRQTRRRNFQNNRIKQASGNFRLGGNTLLNGDAFLEQRNCFPSFSELQLKNVSDDDHDQFLSLNGSLRVSLFGQFIIEYLGRRFLWSGRPCGSRGRPKQAA
jgi:hypothetical protein